MRHTLKLAALFLATLCVGCDRKTVAEPPPEPAKSPTTPGADASKQPKEPKKQSENQPAPSLAQPEEYQKVDQSELPILFQARMQGLAGDSDGNVVVVDGRVAQLSVGKTDIELETDSIKQEGRNAFILTKKYGKLKVTFNSNARATFWLLPSQKTRLMEQLK